MLSLTPHAFFAWRVIFVASGLARCISLPHFGCTRFRCSSPCLSIRDFRAPLLALRIFVAVHFWWDGQVEERPRGSDLLLADFLNPLPCSRSYLGLHRKMLFH